MKIELFSNCMFFLFISVAFAGQIEGNPVTIKTTLCDLTQNPEQFNGKMVEVRASIAGNDLWIYDFKQKPACPAYMGIILVLPDQSKPGANFDLVQDDSLKQFFEDVRKGMNVEATFEGRFEAIYTWRNQKQICIESQEKCEGFGKRGQYGGRIVLHRVSDILAVRVPRL